MALSCPASFKGSSKGVSPRAYEIYIPIKDNSGNKIKPSLIDHFRDEMINHFGGVTITESEGCYYSRDDRKNQCEPILRFSSLRLYDFSDTDPCDQWLQDDNFMDAQTIMMREIWGQEGMFGTTQPLDSFYVGGEKRKTAYPGAIAH